MRRYPRVVDGEGMAYVVSSLQEAEAVRARLLASNGRVSEPLLLSRYTGLKPYGVVYLSSDENRWIAYDLQQSVDVHELAVGRPGTVDT